ncbi:MAG: phage late control D family protein [Gracilibacteraceae bacterium]|jgi:hypothetical protein|nr:phage late control D family protein [Gracilibacteraceae bacterium]
MRIVQIKVSPLELLDVQACDITIRPNEHGGAYIRGIVDSARKDEYIRYLLSEDTVVITGVDSDGGETALFAGMPEEFAFGEQNSLITMELTLKSPTLRMDRLVRSRSYQSEELTYEDILISLGGYPNYGAILNCGDEVTIPHIIVQFIETDWMFLKRLASHFGAMLLPECKSGYTRYYFGLPERKSAGEWTAGHRTTLGVSGGGGAYLQIKVQRRDTHEIGEHVIMDGAERIITELSTVWLGQELVYTYTLSDPRQLRVPRLENPTLTGGSLPGRITAVRGAEVQVSLDIDEEDSFPVGACWLPFASAYSAPDGSGWYAMPEEGDAARVMFPDRDEKNAFVESAVHLTASGEARANPRLKSFRNSAGKELLLAPGEMIMTNNNGMRIAIKDGEGISITSDKAVNIAGRALTVTSGGDVNIAGDENVALQNSDAQMDASGRVGVGGQRVNVNE